MSWIEPSPSQAAGARPFVLHISGDFPDAIEPFKTKVIGTLLALTEHEFDHSVVSINRVSPRPLGVLRDALFAAPLKVETQDFEHGTAIRYEAPPRGLRHKTKLVQLGDWLINFISGLPKRPDLLVGHKLAIEGIAVRRAAQALGLPYALSIQGDSDTKIMGVRRDLDGEFRAVLEGAKAVFPFTPWAWDYVTDRLGVPSGEKLLLPCPTDLDEPVDPVPGGDGLISIFHLQSYRRKNLSGLAKACAILEARGKAAPLSVIGGGESAERAACEAIIKDAPSITLAGAMAREPLRTRMRTASGFVLPSLRESFGLVFVEALFAGVPIIYPKGTAVDGYFEGAPFALKVDARDPSALADAMQTLMEEEVPMKAALAEWQRSPDAKRFQRPAIAEEFARGLHLACRGSASS